MVLHYNAVIRFWWGHLLFLFPRQGTFRMRAFWALPIWMLQQLLGLAGETGVTTVAYSAHVAGFSLGVAAALVFKFTGTDRKLARVSESKAILFSQHPAFVRGMDLLDKGDASGARECFEVVLREAPENTEALVKLAGLVPDPVRAAHLVGRAVMATRKEGDKSTPRNLFIEHQKRHPGEPLSDRVLFAVAECFQVDAPREAISVYEVLLSQHSGSVMAPKAMLNMAIIYRDNLGNPEAARKILAAVQTRYSNSAFAEQAESMDQ